MFPMRWDGMGDGKISESTERYSMAIGWFDNVDRHLAMAMVRASAEGNGIHILPSGHSLSLSAADKLPIATGGDFQSIFPSSKPVPPVNRCTAPPSLMRLFRLSHNNLHLV